jgi:hypothetical protein
MFRKKCLRQKVFEGSGILSYEDFRLLNAKFTHMVRRQLSISDREIDRCLQPPDTGTVFWNIPIHATVCIIYMYRNLYERV